MVRLVAQVVVTAVQCQVALVDAVHADILASHAAQAAMHSIGLINAHFWLATIGTVLYIASMWVNGITHWRSRSGAAPRHRWS